MSYGDDSFVKRFFMKRIDGKWKIISVYDEIIY